jgi:hypothetical protein
MNLFKPLIMIKTTLAAPYLLPVWSTVAVACLGALTGSLLNGGNRQKHLLSAFADYGGVKEGESIGHSLIKNAPGVPKTMRGASILKKINFVMGAGALGEALGTSMVQRSFSSNTRSSEQNRTHEQNRRVLEELSSIREDTATIEDNSRHQALTEATRHGLIESTNFSNRGIITGTFNTVGGGDVMEERFGYSRADNIRQRELYRNRRGRPMGFSPSRRRTG